MRFIIFHLPELSSNILTSLDYYKKSRYRDGGKTILNGCYQSFFNTQHGSLSLFLSVSALWSNPRNSVHHEAAITCQPPDPNRSASRVTSTHLSIFSKNETGVLVE